jgi:1-acyl-sn-glycerol-3-phosphate acyltransferase
VTAFEADNKVVKPKPLARLTAIAMNLTVYPLVALLTLAGILFFLPGLGIWKVVTRWSTGRIVRHFIWFYGRGWIAIMSPFVRFRRQGLSRETPGPSILVINHLSFFDTYCMALLPVSDIAFAVRAWPFRMIWYGYFMRLAEYLNVESGEWQEISRSAEGIFARGGSVLFFPEGHRSRDGELQHFYSGAFRLAIETGRPVVPLCITGTETLLPPGRFWLRPAAVTLRVLEPVDPAGFPGPDGHARLRKEVKALIAANLEQMRRGEGG